VRRQWVVRKFTVSCGVDGGFGCIVEVVGEGVYNVSL
jgi:hypothetical protein